MTQTNLADFEVKTPNDRTVMHVLYALHTLAWFSGGVFAVVALVVNYLKRGDETDALYIDHHTYMIKTFWWTLLWLVLLSPLWLLLVLPGAIAYGIVWLWYLYRCVRGWIRFNDARMT
ncbi:MAG: hypothetical protein H7Z77_01060 [Chitinophagaceae bacterium]|nr:hypothetical protein [Polaromonas sp.]